MTAFNWKPIRDIPEKGKFVVASYAPTNWAYHIRTINLHGIQKHNEMLTKYCVAWDYMPEEPSQEIRELYNN